MRKREGENRRWGEVRNEEEGRRTGVQNNRGTSSGRREREEGSRKGRRDEERRVNMTTREGEGRGKRRAESREQRAESREQRGLERNGVQQKGREVQIGRGMVLWGEVRSRQVEQG
eukprot:61908-Hanusia_phi.AAC.1